MTLINAYTIAEKDNIDIISFDCPESKSLSLEIGKGRYCIGIDKNIKNTAKEITYVMHELGHCKTGSFYNRYSKLDVIGKHERRADTWAALGLMPPEDLRKAFQDGDTEAWQLAERFNITQEFVERAIKIYREKGCCENFKKIHREVISWLT